MPRPLAFTRRSLNGQRVGDLQLAPGWTDYHKRTYYQAFDVTPLLVVGDNTLGAILGDGWYCGHIAWRGRQLYGDRPKFLAQLVIDYLDGRTDVIGTDSTWKFAYGPLLESGSAHGRKLRCAPRVRRLGQARLR